MFLSSLRIQNFRSIKEIELTFKKGVNILIGENNSGKSTVIDALRLGLGYGEFENTINVRETALKAREIGERIVAKMRKFVEVFVRGVSA